MNTQEVSFCDYDALPQVQAEVETFSIKADRVRQNEGRAMLFNVTARTYHIARLRRDTQLANRLREVEERQWWSLDRLQESSWRKVQAMLAFAAERVPYYRAMFKRIGAHPQDIRTLEDFQRLPLLTKEIIQNNFDQLVADGIDRSTLRENHTGGSTGQMLTFYQDGAYWTANAADKFLTFAMCGYRPGDRWVFLWGSDYDAPKGRWVALKQRLSRNRLWVNTFDLDWESLGQYSRALQDFNPKLLVGYVSSLTMLASYIQENGIAGVKPQAVQSAAEALTDAQRQQLESVFGCKVFNRYGCREVGNVAQECDAHAGLHILTETNYVELVNDGRVALPGEQGHIVITNLTNYAFPFIRYDTDDVGIAAISNSVCPCGRGLPKIADVIGRSADIIVSPEGRLLHGEFFTHLFYGVPGVRQFQVIQKSSEILIIRIVKTEAFQDTSLDRLRSLILEHGSPQFSVHFEFLDRIPVSASGKYRFTLSSVPLVEARPRPKL